MVLEEVYSLKGKTIILCSNFSLPLWPCQIYDAQSAGSRGKASGYHWFRNHFQDQKCTMHKQETVQTISENLCCYSVHDERHSYGTYKLWKLYRRQNILYTKGQSWKKKGVGEAYISLQQCKWKIAGTRVRKRRIAYRLVGVLGLGVCVK